MTKLPRKRPQPAKQDPHHSQRQAAIHYGDVEGGLTPQVATMLWNTYCQLQDIQCYAGSKAGPLVKKHYERGHKAGCHTAQALLLAGLYTTPDSPFHSLTRQYSASGCQDRAAMLLGYLAEAHRMGWTKDGQGLEWDVPAWDPEA